MKQTNYHLFDFMDFDPSLQKDEALWKAYAPSKVKERNGDVNHPCLRTRHSPSLYHHEWRRDDGG